MDLLPIEIFRLILSFLPASNLLLGKRCCKRWKVLAEDILEKCPVEIGFAYVRKYYNGLTIATHRGDMKPYLVEINSEKLKKSWYNSAYIQETILQGIGVWKRGRTFTLELPSGVFKPPYGIIWFDQDKNMRLIEKFEKINEFVDIKHTFVVKQSERGTSWISEIKTIGSPGGPIIYKFPNNLDSYLSDYQKQRVMNLLTFRKDKVTLCLIKPRKNRFMIRKKFLDEYKVPNFGCIPEIML
jgi:hypothetical protein